MLAVAVFLAIAAQGLEAVDDANLALTTCGFAVYREANGEDRPLDEFNASLASRCSKPMADMRAAMIALQVQRGKGRAAASAAANSLIAEFRARFANHYAKRAETNAQLRELERALREEENINAR